MGYVSCNRFWEHVPAVHMPRSIDRFPRVERMPRSREDDQTSRARVAGGFAFELFICNMNDRLSALRLFVRVAHRGNFSAGGRELKLSQPTPSRSIASWKSKSAFWKRSVQP